MVTLSESIRTYKIEIVAKTLDDATLALNEVLKAIAEGYQSAPWNDDGDESGYSFTSQSEFAQPTISPNLVTDPALTDILAGKGGA